MRRQFAILLALSASVALFGQESKPAPPLEKPLPAKEEKPVITHHTLKRGNRTLNYTATAGMMPLKTDAGEIEANVFYIAYTLDRPANGPKRPLTFSFNGGPGSASVWLHMGALGPRRVKLNDDGSLPAPPYQIVDNEYTWLDQTDLCFIDPVGTGFSRATKAANPPKKFWGVDGDIASVGEFIRLYLGQNQRWTSPLFLAGESYGTTRAAGLSGYLIERGIAFNGIVLISTVLNFQTNRFGVGNDLPYALFLPTYTASAWYHKRLPPALQGDLREAVREAEKFALGEYMELLAKGDALTPTERAAAVAKVAQFTGLSPTYVSQSNLRIEIMHFIKELLRSEGQTVGRLDSRLKGVDRSGISESAEFDPSMTTIRPPYTAALNQYVREELNYSNDLTYWVLGGGFEGWDWGKAQNSYADTSDALRSAFAKNPHMKLYIGYGYYDLATPMAAAKYTLHHMNLPPEAWKNVTESTFEAGHMFYIHLDSLRKFRGEIAKFIADAAKS